MPRYTKQRTQTNCAPTAILNALRWAGDRTPYEEIMPALFQMCRTDAGARGTLHGHIDQTLRQAGQDLFRVRRVMWPTLHETERHLKTGGAVLLSYQWEHQRRRARHCTLLVGVSPKGTTFYTVNNFRGRGVPALCAEHRPGFVARSLQFQRVDPRHRGWFLTLE